MGLSVNYPKFVDGKFHLDDRGYLEFCNDLDLTPFVRFYIIENSSESFVRAWHGHKEEAKAFVCLRGEFKVAAVKVADFNNPDVTEQAQVFHLGSKKPGGLVVPPGYANGTMNYSRDSRLLVFSSSTVEESMQDDFRFDWRTWDVWTSEYR